MAERFGAALGFLAGSILRLRRGVAGENLRRALGTTRAEAARILRLMYRHLGLSLVEFLRLSRWTPERIAERVQLDGFERLREAMRSGRGVVVITAHFGNWDLLACLSARLGVPLHVVTR